MIEIVVRVRVPPFVNLDALAYKTVEVLGVQTLSDSIPDEQDLSFPRAQILQTFDL